MKRKLEGQRAHLIPNEVSCEGSQTYRVRTQMILMPCYDSGLLRFCRVRRNRWPVASIFTVGPVKQNKDRPAGPATFASSNRQIFRTSVSFINKVLADKYSRQSHYSVKIVDFRSVDSLPKNLVGSRLFGIHREKHGSAQLKKSTIMDCFLTNSKKHKVEITNNEKSKAYQTEKRKRVFIPSWTTTYPWLQNGI